MRKINFHLLILSLICIALFSIATIYILRERTVRVNGTIVNATILKIGHAKTHRKAMVQVGGARLSAGTINNSYKTGDTIRVYYIQGINTVVQESIHPQRYYWYLLLAFIPLILGVMLFIESLKGKSIWSY